MSHRDDGGVQVLMIDLNQTQVCCDCGEEKPISCFSVDRAYTTKIKHRPDCNECRNRHKRIAEIAKRTAPPKPDVCDCCGEVPKKWQMDHDHETGKFRGWICVPCNRGIGMLGDNEEGLKKALNYLKRAKKKYG
jgi:hypothetical protein